MSKEQGLCVAVIGATGAVGHAMIKVLEERKFPVRQLRLGATARSAGQTRDFKGQPVVVEDVDKFSFEGVQVALFAGGEVASETYASKAVAAGCVVIDNSAVYRMDPNVPLVVPEVNPEALHQHKGIIANPNCSTIQMMVAIKPLLPWGLKRVVVSTYQSVSGTGKDAIDELDAQAKALAQQNLKPQELKADHSTAKVYPVPIAFNLIPQIASIGEDGITGEERKMILESRKILGIENLAVSATCVRVPVFFAHSESVNLEFEKPFELSEVRQALEQGEGLVVCKDGPEPTPLQAQHQDLVWVGRIRRDTSIENGLQLWVVADNLRKGAASNAIQIAEKMLELKLL